VTQKDGSADPQADPLCSGCRPIWGSQPTPAQYRDLLNELAILQVWLEREKIELPLAAITALQRTILYLNSDPLSVKLGLTRLLALILNHLHDISHGANPSRIFNQTHRKGGPTELSRAACRAQINIMFKSLTRLGMNRQDAGKLLADKFKRNGVKENGDPITAKAIMRWHGEIGGKSLSGSDKVYKKLKGDLDRTGWPSDLKEAQAFIKSRILALRDAGHL
jgi:hypothetical protein